MGKNFILAKSVCFRVAFSKIGNGVAIDLSPELTVEGASALPTLTLSFVKGG